MKLWDRIMGRSNGKQDEESVEESDTDCPLNGGPSASLIYASFDRVLEKSSERLSRVEEKARALSLPPQPMTVED